MYNTCNAHLATVEIFTRFCIIQGYLEYSCRAVFLRTSFVSSWSCDVTTIFQYHAIIHMSILGLWCDRHKGSSHCSVHNIFEGLCHLLPSFLSLKWISIRSSSTTPTAISRFVGLIWHRDCSSQFDTMLIIWY